uniref:L-type lectin-like domain-containing protein n=1 Tax=Megaselia scalaris TaxID=36166 RepID=T1H0B7_MEGSC
MSNLIYSILFLTLSTVSSIVAELDAGQSYVSRDHSLTRPYPNVGKLWDFSGHTMITNNYVRLTPDLQSKSGAIWNTSPIMTKNWELQVTFKVHGKGTELFGDGFALWYAQERMMDGPVFGSKDYFSVQW